MESIDVITSKENPNRVYKKVVANKGAGGVDGMKAEELGAYIRENKDEIVQSIRNQTYWLRHKIRVIVLKQWKTPKTIYQNLSYLNRKYGCGFDHEAIYKVANSRLGWYRRSGMNVVNYIISPEVLETKIKGGAGLLNPLNYYLRNAGI